MPGLCKIGSGEDPQVRLAEANSIKPVTWMPTKYRIEFAIKVQNYEKRERAIHVLLDHRNANPDRDTSGAKEWFKIDVADVCTLFNLMEQEVGPSMTVVEFKQEVETLGITSIEEYVTKKLRELPTIVEIEAGYFVGYNSLSTIMGWSSNSVRR